MSSVLLKGRYLGNTFQDVLSKDLNYCKFIVSIKFISKELKEFQDWLNINIDVAIANHTKKELERISKVLSA